eukprot:12751134-Heterocapsa_arctica.AAC.1
MALAPTIPIIGVLEFTYTTSMEYLSKHTVLRNNATLAMLRNNEADDDLAVTQSAPRLQVDGHHGACKPTP